MTTAAGPTHVIPRTFGESVLSGTEHQFKPKCGKTISAHINGDLTRRGARPTGMGPSCDRADKPRATAVATGAGQSCARCRWAHRDESGVAGRAVARPRRTVAGRSNVAAAVVRSRAVMAEIVSDRRAALQSATGEGAGRKGGPALLIDELGLAGVAGGMPLIVVRGVVRLGFECQRRSTIRATVGR